MPVENRGGFIVASFGGLGSLLPTMTQFSHYLSRCGYKITWLFLFVCGFRVFAQPVQGNILSVGFEAKSQSRFVIREGCWFPAVLRLMVPGTEHFQGNFECERLDLDGDRVLYTEGPVAVTAGKAREVWLYAAHVNKDSGSGTIEFRAVDERSKVVIPLGGVQRPDVISNDAELILDISSKPVEGLRAFDSSGLAGLGAGIWGQRNYYRVLTISEMSHKNLPDRWFGLEAVSTIVWDEPNPDDLSNDQIAALIQWVRAGGKLVLGIGGAWLKLQKSPMREILPLQGDAPPVVTAYLKEFAKRFTANGKVEDFKSPLNVVIAEKAPDSLITVKDLTAEGKEVPLVSMRWVGSGRVTAVAARLTDLAATSPKRAFYRELIDINEITGEFKTKESEKNYLIKAVDLYGGITRATEFSRTASIRMLSAFTFVGAYIGLATIVSWMWLSKQKLTHLSWSVFAGFAVIASALGVVAVFFLRGAVDRVASVNIVDMESGSPRARAHAWFGYKSWASQFVEISLPGDANYLRPLSMGPGSAGSYATPLRYSAAAAKATLSGTPMRATLKQFEGFWQGEAEGAIRAGLVADRKTGRLTQDSWIQSDLSDNIVGGFVLYIDPRLGAEQDDPVPQRAAGLDSVSYQGSKFRGATLAASSKLPPAFNVLVTPLPALKPALRTTAFPARAYEEFDKVHEKWVVDGENEKTEPFLNNLWWTQNYYWMESLRPTLTGGTLPPNDAAMLLASTRNLYLHNGPSSSNSFLEVGFPISSEGLVDLDVTHWLTAGQAVMLLFTDGPGPATLHVDGRPLRAREGRTLIRVRVPIEYVKQ